MIPPLRVFLDANVLFSAVYRPPNTFERFWLVPGLDLLTSPYVIDEVSRHFRGAEDRARLWRLLYATHLVPNGDEIELPRDIRLVPKDVPILQAAIAGKADILVTGDETHFLHLFGTSVQGVLIEKPSTFKARYPEIFKVEPARP